MGETALEVVAIEFLSFFFGVIENVISVLVFWWMVYIVLRFLLLNVIFKEDESGWKRFAENIRIGAEELSGAFLETMSGLVLIAKQWHHEKKEELEMHNR